MIAPLLAELTGHFVRKVNQFWELFAREIQELFTEIRCRVNRFERTFHGRVRCDQPVDLLAQLSQQIQVGPELIEFSRPPRAVFRNLLSGGVILLKEMKGRRQAAFVLASGSFEGGPHQLDLVLAEPLFVVNKVLALAPRYINSDGNADDAAHCLHPCSPINYCCGIGAVVDAIHAYPQVRMNQIITVRVPKCNRPPEGLSL